MSAIAFWGAVELGLVYALLALGIMVSYRILNIADLTVEGSFTTGAAVSAVLTTAGHPVLGIVIAMAASACAGIVSALLQTKLRIQSILAGILTMTGLYSINLRIMGGKSNVSLLRLDTIFTPFERLFGSWGKLALILLILLAAAVVLDLFFRTQVGLSVRATGDNEEMVRSSSINSDFTKALGLGVSGSLVGLSGSVIAQYQSFADVSMGVGMVVVALASLIIGEVLFCRNEKTASLAEAGNAKSIPGRAAALFLRALRILLSGRRSVTRNIFAVSVGAVIYRLILTLVLSSTSNTGTKLVITVLITATVSLLLGILAVQLLFQLLPALREKSLWLRAILSLLAAVPIYFIAYNPVSALGPSDMKLISAVIVAAAIAAPAVKNQWQVHKLRRKAGAYDVASK